MLFAPYKVATVEKATTLEALVPGLQALGETVTVAPMGLKANAIERVGNRWVGAADPRSEGVAIDVTGRTTEIQRVGDKPGRPPE